MEGVHANADNPAPETSFSDEKIRETLKLVELDDLAGRLDETDHWEKRMSAGEQQRIGIARALLHEPRSPPSYEPRETSLDTVSGNQLSTSRLEVTRTHVQPVSLQTRLSAVPGSARL